MIFKRFFLFFLLVSICCHCKAQDAFKINLRAIKDRTFISSIHFIDNNAPIYIDSAGRLMLNYDAEDNGDNDFWDGDNRDHRTRGNVSPNLDYPDAGDRGESRGKVVPTGNVTVTYYTRFDGDDVRGKIKSIGNVTYTYYSRFDGDEVKGKIKSIGDVKYTYYTRFDGDEVKGKIKSIGNVTFAYYTRFDGDEVKGKIKSIGNVKYTYYTRFDGDEVKGKVKSIGNTSITYYDRFDSAAPVGYIKNITGVTPNLNIIWRKSQYTD